MDVVGGVLSVVQVVLDSLLEGDWSGVTGNPVKFGLGIVTIGADAVFLVQHYVLYHHMGRPGNVKDGESGEEIEERRRLLVEAEGAR